MIKKIGLVCVIIYMVCLAILCAIDELELGGTLMGGTLMNCIFIWASGFCVCFTSGWLLAEWGGED